MPVGEKNKRINITINKELDKAIEGFLEQYGARLDIPSKSYLFQMAIVEWFGRLEGQIYDKIKENTKKGD